MSGIESIKQLRARAHASLMGCKSALEDAGGDVERAFELLGERGACAHKSSRVARPRP